MKQSPLGIFQKYVVHCFVLTCMLMMIKLPSTQVANIAWPAPLIAILTTLAVCVYEFRKKNTDSTC